MSKQMEAEESSGAAVNARRSIRILFATDGSEEADDAGRFIRRLPLPPGSAIRVVSVVDAMGWPETPAWYLESGREWGLKTVEQARAALSREDVEVSAALRYGARAAEIIQAADEFNADVLALASQRLSRLEAFWLGAITRGVARHAHCPVLVARDLERPLRRVVLAVDESAHSRAAADFMARFPLPAEAEVEVVNVVRPYQPFPGLVPSDPTGFQREVEEVRRRLYAAGSELVEQLSRRIAGAGKQVTTSVREGDPAEEVLRLGEEREADLIVAGARGVSMIRGLLMGSVADRLLESAGCSLLLVR
jgi:nucleotide-binding universal stress UspA family protein